MAVTQKQIAERLGVSRQLVGFALSEGGTISPETRRQIRQEAQSLGYRPNGMARAMKSGRFGSVALLLSATKGGDYLPPALLNGIHDELAAHDLHLMIARLPDEQLTSSGFVPKILREWMVDGLLIDYISHIPAPMIEIIRENQVPAAWINSRQDADVVRPDDVDAGRRATRHLLELGHRRIAYLDYVAAPYRHYSRDDRRDGYEAEMRASGLEPRVIRPRSWPEGAPQDAALHAAARDEVAQELSRGERPSALVSYAPGIGVRAALSLGLRVPGDLSIVTFLEGGVQDTPMSAMTIPNRQVGREAVRMLLRKIASPESVLPPVAVPFGFEPGESCAPLSA